MVLLQYGTTIMLVCLYHYMSAIISSTVLSDSVHTTQTIVANNQSETSIADKKKEPP